MAQPNVMREPSMEEILASIRKIIENNDPPEALDVSHLSGQTRDARESIHLTIDDDLASMAANQGSAPAVEPAESLVASPAGKPEQTQSRPMSLADVAARVKAAADRRAPANDTEAWSRTDGAAKTADVPAMNERDASVIMPDAAAKAPEPETLAAADFELSAYAASYVDELHDLPAATEDAPDADMPQAEPAEPAHAEDAIERFAMEIGNQIAATVPTQLLSPSVEEKVSRSFEELAEALGGAKRSLEEIAEEMLRPMLQEWLDDNLPTMVERLVREEIERVARGPRR